MSFEEYNVEPTHHGECKEERKAVSAFVLVMVEEIDKHKLHSPSKTINTIGPEQESEQVLQLTLELHR